MKFFPKKSRRSKKTVLAIAGIAAKSDRPALGAVISASVARVQASLWHFLKRLFMLIGGLIFCVVLLSVLGRVLAPLASLMAPSEMVLSVDLSRPVREAPPADLRAQLAFPDALLLHDVTDAIRLAEKDPRVKALSVELGGRLKMGMAQAKEIRDAVSTFRASGKETHLYASSFGTMGGGTGAYYLASAFEDIWQQPSGDWGVTGMALRLPFFKKGLEKIGVKASFTKKHEYKNAMAPFTEESLSKPYQESMTDLLDSLFGSALNDMATSRGMNSNSLKNLIDRAPLSAEAAKQEKLVDRLAYRPAYYKALKKIGKSISLEDYRQLAAHQVAPETAPLVAVIVAQGMIVEGKSALAPDMRRSLLGRKTLSAHLEAAYKDKRVKAVLLRVDSPGGSYTASDALWHDIHRLRKAGKPVVASIGNVAASGGYFLAMAADKIVAQPTSVTGSIGVVGGKFEIKGLLEKLGIGVSQLSRGKNAGMLSAEKPFTAKEKAQLNKMLDRIYADFAQKAATDRGMTAKEMDKLARGRVFTGAQAAKNGLVDAVGGMDAALAMLKADMGLADEDAVRFVFYPQPQSLMERVKEALEGKVGAQATVSSILAPVLSYLPAGYYLQGDDRFLLMPDNPRID